MDHQKLDSFFQKVVADLGGAFSIAPVRIGGALGIYSALARPTVCNSLKPPGSQSATCANGCYSKRPQATLNMT